MGWQWRSEHCYFEWRGIALVNYYIEGLVWLINKMDIDGIFLDDVSFDRHILKRMRKVMKTSKSGCMIDLHSNTGFSIVAANQYLEFFPYIDKTGFGEGFNLDLMPADFWLTEVSGRSSFDYFQKIIRSIIVVSCGFK